MTDARQCDRREVYCILVQGNLDRRWSDWFDGFLLTKHRDQTTMLTGPVADQAALHGLLAKIRDLGLPLLSVERVEDDAARQSGAAGG